MQPRSAIHRVGSLALFGLFSLLPGNALSGQAAVQPSFSCARATTPTELLICSDAGLAGEERRMSDDYEAVLRSIPEGENQAFRREHYEWFREYSYACNAPMADSERRSCILEHLRTHSQYLESRLSGPGQAPSSGSSARAGQAGGESRVSLVQKFVPPDLDPGGRYTTYSADELYNAFAAVAGINNDFEGKPVKVFAKYFPAPAPLRALRTGWRDYGCYDEICDHLDPLLFLSVGKTLGNSITLRDPLVTLYFENDAYHSQLIAASKQACPSYMYPCLIWVKGTLGYTIGNFKNAFGTRKSRIIYMRVEEFRVYENHNNDVLEALKLGAGFGAKLADMFSSK
jgi:hypothetical protein